MNREPKRWVGQSVPRIEDRALLRGQARFIDDIHPADLLHAVMVRSEVAHGQLEAVDLEPARALPGVAAAFALADLAPHLTSTRIPLAMPSPAIHHEVNPEVLAGREVVHIGQPIAVIVATSRAVAEDAAGLVRCDIAPLPAVADPVDALAQGAPRALSQLPDNLCASFTTAYGDIDAAFRGAAHTVTIALHQHKGGGMAMECRAVLAAYDDVQDLLTVWDGTQMPHRAKGLIVDLLGWREDQVRVICPDVGGGFGPKFVFYSEEIVIPLLAWLLRRPVKWIEDRREHLIATTQERDQYWSLEAAVDADGRLRGIRGSLVHDHGAFTPYGLTIPFNAVTNLLGPYHLPAYALTARLAFTNKIAATPTRGAGRPQGTFVMERVLDEVARALRIDRAEVRRRNLILPEQMPYATPLKTRDGGTMIYDGGDYPATQAAALKMAGYGSFAERQETARKAGRLIGIGIANYVEGSGRGPFESAVVRVGPSGAVTVASGVTAQGQGIATALAQIAADALDVALDAVSVTIADTMATSLGVGAFASRQAAVGGAAVHHAALAVRDKALSAAAQMLDASAQDLEITDGIVRLRQRPEPALHLGEIARALTALPGYAIPAGSTPGLEASVTFAPEAMSYCNGCHVAEVEVDVETGGVSVTRYVVVHDSGRLINPRIVEGQIVGGLVHALGNALLEELVFDGDAQPLSTNFAEYLLANAVGLPRIEIKHMVTPTPLNPLGAKGAGESGTLPVTAAIASAVEHALAPFEVRIRRVPIRPMDIVSAITCR